jgi:uncharacterized hydrophobic protein (TIGR00271 family)
MMWLRKIFRYVNLKGEIDDFESIHLAIEKGIIFRGTNLWILMFAIIVASVGLNINSTAVIIGAMLISPLMGPINGVGYSIATYNFPLFRQAVKNFGFAVGTSLMASTLYFAISPVSTAHSELLARTSPTIYDVLIALFGGLAGIVAISSKQKGNVIPGVAIATALMPPLCTAGFGLATGKFSYFLGAMYLFTINSVFIALAALAVSQILKFPITAPVDEARKARINHWITAIILVTVIPSVYFGHGLVKKEEFSMNAARLIKNVDLLEGNYLLKSEVEPGRRHVTLVYAGKRMDDSTRAIIVRKAADFSIGPSQLSIQQGLSLDNPDAGREAADLRSQAEINRLKLIIRSLEQRHDSLTQRSEAGRQLLAEMARLYPQVTACSVSETLVFASGREAPAKLTVVTVSLKDKLGEADRGRLEGWLTARLGTSRLKLFFE